MARRRRKFSCCGCGVLIVLGLLIGGLRESRNLPPVPRPDYKEIDRQNKIKQQQYAEYLHQAQKEKQAEDERIRQQDLQEHREQVKDNSIPGYGGATGSNNFPGQTVHVNGYMRQNGTYVHSYNRSAPGYGHSASRRRR